MEKIVIEIDSDLADLIPSYIKNREEDVINMRSELDEGNFDNVRIAGHSMKGSGGSYGFSEISQIGADIEIAANANDGEKIKSLITQLETYLSVIEIKY